MSPSSNRRYPRTARLNEVVREVIAEALEQMVDEDERLELVTITGVEVTRDLRQATVYYSARREGADVALEEHRTKLQSEIAHQVRMKRTPQLAFVVDSGITSGWKIEGILRELHSEKGRDEGDD